jgi:ADP-heptose:LPS heptosyltransferase
MQGLLKSAVVVGKARAGRKLGFHWQREGAALFSAAVMPDPSSLHVVDQYVDVARELGADMDRAEFGLVPSEESLLDAKRLLGEVQPPFVVVNAGAGWATKRWPSTSFARVIAGLGESGVPTVLVGGTDYAAKEAGEAVHAACQKLGVAAPVSLLGETSVAQLIALISLSTAHLGGDTGSTHIAAALGIPAVGLYSITRPERCCPYGQIDRTHYSPAGLDRIQPEPILQSLLAEVKA